MGAIVTSGPRPPRSRRCGSLRVLPRPRPRARPASARARPRARSRRDWLVDTACFVLAIAGGDLRPGAPCWRTAPTPSSTATALIVAAGVVACLAIWLRRRWPVGVALLTVVLGSVSPRRGRRRADRAVQRGGAPPLGGRDRDRARWPSRLLPLYFSLYPDDIPFWVNVALATGIQAAVVGWGMFIRSQRELMLALRERTRQAEAERDLRVRQARAQERTRIAREMHDVLAHRLSLLSLHAGALEVHPDAPPEEIARAARRRARERPPGARGPARGHRRAARRARRQRGASARSRRSRDVADARRGVARRGHRRRVRAARRRRAACPRRPGGPSTGSCRRG